MLYHFQIMFPLESLGDLFWRLESKAGTFNKHCLCLCLFTSLPFSQETCIDNERPWHGHLKRSLSQDIFLLEVFVCYFVCTTRFLSFALPSFYSPQQIMVSFSQFYRSTLSKFFLCNGAQ